MADPVMFDPNVMPDFTAQAAAIAQQRKMADYLRQQAAAQKSPEGQMVGKRYVAPSPFEYGAGMMDKFFAGNAERQANQAEQDYQTGVLSKTREWMNNAPQGTPAVEGRVAMQAPDPITGENPTGTSPVAAVPAQPPTYAEGVKYAGEGLVIPGNEKRAMLAFEGLKKAREEADKRYSMGPNHVLQDAQGNIIGKPTPAAPPTPTNHFETNDAGRTTAVVPDGKGGFVKTDLGAIGKTKTQSGNTTVVMPNDEIASAAAQHAAGQPLNQIAPGMGKGAAENRSKIRAGAIKLIQDQTPGMTAADAGGELAARSLGFGADKSSLGQITKMEGATIPIVKQLNYNVDQTSQLMKKMGGRDISPVLNAIADNVQTWTGDPAFSPLFYHMGGAVMEAAKLRTGGQASVAQLNVAAQEEAKKWAGMHMTPETWDQLASALKAEGVEKLKYYGEAGDYIKRRGGGSTGNAGVLPKSTGAKEPNYVLIPGKDPKLKSSYRAE